jgi:hypothetical protein
MIEKPKIAHTFFDCPRWIMLLASKDGDQEKFSRLDINTDGIILDIYTEFKNYDCEIDLFLDWIKPYLLHTHEKEILGWFKYEFADVKTIIQFVPEIEDIELVEGQDRQ